MKKVYVFLLICVVFMELTVQYQGTGQPWKNITLEKGVTISKERNTAATITINIPRSVHTEQMSAYNKMRVYLDDYNLFDGKTQNKKYSRDYIQFSGYDLLWDFSNERRMFEQGSTEIRPDEAFTDVFDKDSTSSYFDGIWEDYTTPWIEGFDATTYVVPAEVAITYGNQFFDCIDKSGTDYMKYLADISHRGNIYKYFYWYELINDTKTLFFQPDGWGKLWTDLSYTVTSELEEVIENLWNNIIVKGRKIRGYLASDGDNWTESTPDGWIDYSYPVGAVDNPVISSDNPVKGNWNLKLTADFSIRNNHHIARNLLQNNSFVDISSLEQVYHQAKISVVPSNFEYYIEFVDAAIETLTSPNQGSTFVADDTWYVIDLDNIDLDTWTDSGSFDKTNVKRIRIRMEETDGVDRTFYFDNFYLKFASLRSENTSNATGYDSSSAEEYGKRTPPTIVHTHLKTIDQCNAFASNLVNYYKDPQYSISMKFPCFMPFRLNDRIKFTEYGKTLTLPVHKLKWEFKSSEEIITSVTLGTGKLDIIDRLKKISQDVKEPSKDYGLQYYIF